MWAVINVRACLQSGFQTQVSMTAAMERNTRSRTSSLHCHVSCRLQVIKRRYGTNYSRVNSLTQTRKSLACRLYIAGSLRRAIFAIALVTSHGIAVKDALSRFASTVSIHTLVRYTPIETVQTMSLL